ncbi:MAG: Nramp family divalent metal transporter [Dehalococcoidales bacterium]|nr:Nramp family divalent metal transporter [Dehalococcoidales bacterium]
MPALVASAVAVSGISALIGRLLTVALPGDPALYSILIILVSLAIVVTGRYRVVEKVTSVMAIILVLAAITAAVMVFSSAGELMAGLIPHIPEGFDLYFTLPWFAFLVAGAIGIVWYSYWVAARGYGGKMPGEDGLSEEGDIVRESQKIQEKVDRLRGWTRIMSTAAAIGIFGGGVVTLSFLVLGAEVLRPEGIIPEGIAVAENLTLLLSQIWGAIGLWIILVGMFIALWGTILANQDGGGRSYSDATFLLLMPEMRKASSGKSHTEEPLSRWRRLLSDRKKLKNFYSIVVTALIPIIVFFVLRDPVDILSIGGIIAASHTPVVIGLTLYLNSTSLPEGLRPGKLSLGIMVFAAMFYVAFATVFYLELFGITLPL